MELSLTYTVAYDLFIQPGICRMDCLKNLGYQSLLVSKHGSPRKGRRVFQRAEGAGSTLLARLRLRLRLCTSLFPPSLPLAGPTGSRDRWMPQTLLDDTPQPHSHPSSGLHRAGGVEILGDLPGRGAPDWTGRQTAAAPHLESFAAQAGNVIT